MAASRRRETRMVVFGIGLFVVSMLVVFALVARVALYQLDQIYGDLEEFTETEISLTRIVTRVQQRQSDQRLALERILGLQRAGTARGDPKLRDAVSAFREHGLEIQRELGRGVDIAGAAATISRAAGDEYTHMQSLLISLQDQHREFERRAADVVDPEAAGGIPVTERALEEVDREAGDVGREAEELLIELQSFMEERSWQVEAHGDRAVRTIAVVSMIGTLVAMVFGAYVLLSTFSHMEERRRDEEALRASEARHVADLSILQESAAELATLATEGGINQLVEQQVRVALDLEWAAIGRDTGPAPGAIVTVPISFGGERLGTLSCGPRSSGEPLSLEEHQLLRSVGAQAAVALHNARTIRELRRANESLLRNARLVAVGEFAGAVAHGIRNPLAGVRAAAQAAHRKAREGPLAESLQAIMSEADRLDGRIRSLLDFSRPHEIYARKTDLRELVRSVSRTVSGLPASVGTEVRTDLPTQPVEVEADPNYLEEALLELSVNALRAMPDGGELRLHLEAKEGGATLTVQDTGGGIPEGVRHRVFDLFFTTRSEGTGMGLANVMKIIEAHGGRLTLERTGEEGTTFRIELGLAADSGDEEPGRPSPA